MSEIKQNFLIFYDFFLAVQDRLFKLVGHTALMCRIDGSHFGDQGLLQKV